MRWRPDGCDTLHVSEYRLSQEIIRRSNASTWPAARQEWTLEKVFIQSQPSRCLCGQFPIKEICVLKNRLNGNRAEVGNVCVHQFLGLPSRKIFLALERVGRDDSRALNPEAIEHAHQRRWINDWEKDFYLDTWRKRALTSRQLAVRQRINRRVLANTKR
jgi:hypothetical protein